MQPGRSTTLSKIGAPALAAAALLLTAVPVAPAAAAGTATHIDSGASSSHSSGGVTWASDRGFTGGSVSTWSSVTGTTDPGRYGSVRYGMSGYDLPMSEGQYDVTLHMMEPWATGTGQRVFDVALEGDVVLDNLDLYRAAGGRLRAHDRTFRVDVTGQNLNIDFTASVNRPIVSSISVVPVTSGSTTTTTTTTTTTSTGMISGYPFGAASVWRQDVSRAPLHSRSSDLVRHLSRSVSSRYNGTAAFNVREYNATYYIAAADTPRVTVKFNNCQGTNNTYGLYDGPKHFVSVPIPSGAVPARGDDRAMSIYSPSTNQLWEFWKAEKRTDGWYACWGGRIDSVSTNPGHFSGTYGTTATGLPHAGGQIRIADVRSGRIPHAVALLLAEPRHRSVYSWPAQRSDGWVSSTDAIPEGLRLRLDPTVNVDALDLHPIAKMVARAAQKHGFIAVDASGATGVYAESGLAEAKRTGVDPWTSLLGGTPQYEVMKNVPWHRLQAMPVSYGKP